MLKVGSLAGGRLARFLSTSSYPPRPTNIVLRASPPASRILKVLEVGFNNGETYSYSAEFLRVQSPSAEGKRPTARGEVRVMLRSLHPVFCVPSKSCEISDVVAGRRHVAILSVEPVGNYAIRILFDDLHTTGIYTWNYLHSLGQQKFRVMREYLKALKQQGLSRDPLKKVASAASR